MPQPIRNIPPDMEWGPDVLRQHPELGINVAVIAATWGEVEGELGKIAAFLLGAHSAVGVRMYMALSAAASRNSALRAAAASMLPEEMQRELSEVIVEAGARQKERNRIVHASWAYSAKYPGALLHIDPIEETLMFGDVAAAIYGAPLTGKIELSARAKAPRLRQYTQRDFTAIEERITALYRKAMMLWVKISDYQRAQWHERARRDAGPPLYTAGDHPPMHLTRRKRKAV